MKYVLVIDVADDIAEDYEDFTVDYDFRGTPKENQMVNESIKYIENAEPRPLPKKMDETEYMQKVNSDGDWYEQVIGWNMCIDEITGETE